MLKEQHNRLHHIKIRLIRSYVDDAIVYCSQLSATGMLQFSYIQTGSNEICVSGLYSAEGIIDSYGSSAGNTYCESINKTVINNTQSFDLEYELAMQTKLNTRAFSNLQDAVENVFGTNYYRSVAGSSRKCYNGVDYSVFCWESQSSSAHNGLTYTLNILTVDRCDVTIMRDRIVTVVGYNETQYWTGWTRKMYFLNGEYGWTHDSTTHYDAKDPDYDNVSYLMQHGFDNFVEFTLLGGY